ncbi:unnamed protein product, partial [Ectocarpus sp. 8 AP-2014]
LPYRPLLSGLLLAAVPFQRCGGVSRRRLGVTRNSPLDDARTGRPFQDRHAIYGNFAKIKAGMFDHDHFPRFSRSFGHGVGAARGNRPAATRTRASANRENKKKTS